MMKANARRCLIPSTILVFAWLFLSAETICAASNGDQNADADSPVKWMASWIWYPARQGTVNYHFFARRSFELPETPQRAALHLSAQTEYQLHINGQFVGRGPTP